MGAMGSGRMVRLALASALFLSACSVTPSAKQDLDPGSRTNRFDCVAEAGSYSELNSAISGASVWVTGFMQVLTLRTGSAWPPDAGVVFAGTHKLPRVGLEAFVLPDKPGILQIAVRGAGGAADHTVFTTVPISDSQIRFTLRLSGSGQMSLSVGDAETSLSVGMVDVTRMNLYCSSAHVGFSEVQMGADNR